MPQPVYWCQGFRGKVVWREDRITPFSHRFPLISLGLVIRGFNARPCCRLSYVVKCILCDTSRPCYSVGVACVRFVCSVLWRAVLCYNIAHFPTIPAFLGAFMPYSDGFARVGVRYFGRIRHDSAGFVGVRPCYMFGFPLFFAPSSPVPHKKTKNTSGADSLGLPASIK